MKKSTSLLRLFACGALLALAAGCATKVEYNPGFVVESNTDIENLVINHATMEGTLQPSRIYIAKEFADVFKLDKMGFIFNEEGLLDARVMGRTNYEKPCKWLFEGTAPYELFYAFVWFDSEGKAVETTIKPRFLRKTMPGDIVKFSCLAPSEECRTFSFIVGLVPPATKEEGNSDAGSDVVNTESTVPVKSDDEIAKPISDSSLAPATTVSNEQLKDIGRWD